MTVEEIGDDRTAPSRGRNVSGGRPGAALLLREECEPVRRGRKSRTAVAGRRSRRSRSSIRHVKSRTCWLRRIKQYRKGLENGDNWHRREFAIDGNPLECRSHSHSPNQLAAIRPNAVRRGLLAPLWPDCARQCAAASPFPTMSNIANMTMLQGIPLLAFAMPQPLGLESITGWFGTARSTMPIR